KNGVYLITGGLGDVGMLLAEYLARTVQAKLVLAGRTALPDREKWDEWLADPEAQADVREKIRKVKALEQMGAEVLVVSADVANADHMRSVMDQVNQRFGQLHGVLHAAGVTSGPSLYKPLTVMGPTESEAQFQPKVYGVYVLDEVLQGKDVDFCLL